MIAAQRALAALGGRGPVPGPAGAAEGGGRARGPAEPGYEGGRRASRGRGHRHHRRARHQHPGGQPGGQGGQDTARSVLTLTRLLLHIKFESSTLSVPNLHFLF